MRKTNPDNATKRLLCGECINFKKDEERKKITNPFAWSGFCRKSQSQTDSQCWCIFQPDPLDDECIRRVERTCITCGEFFIPWNKGQEYCSAGCKKGKPTRTKICKCCGLPLNSKSATQLFCSNECTYATRRKESAIRREKREIKKRGITPQERFKFYGWEQTVEPNCVSYRKEYKTFAYKLDFMLQEKEIIYSKITQHEFSEEIEKKDVETIDKRLLVAVAEQERILWGNDSTKQH